MFEDIKDVVVKVEKQDNIEHLSPSLIAIPAIIGIDESRVLSENTGDLRKFENEVQASTCEKKTSFADMIEHRKANTKQKRKRDKENEDPSCSPRKRKKLNE